MGKLSVSKEDIFTYDELFDSKTRTIAQELAQALNQNSVERIKELKYIYSDCKEFVKAKKVLDKKCKEVYNPFENPNNMPVEAMKSLGITNQPSLEFLLGDSVRYFEKTNGSMTAQIIENTLNNKNLEYTMADIHAYLARLHKKEGCNYNPNTITYLINKQNYNKEKLTELGINTKKSTKNLSVSEYLKYIIRNLKK